MKMQLPNAQGLSARMRIASQQQALNVLASMPAWDDQCRATISTVTCIGAGLAAVLLLLWSATDPSMAHAERVALVLTPLDRIDVTLLHPLGIEINVQAVAQGIAGGIAMYVVPLLVMLLQSH